jgi:hypothetical protein
MRTIGHREDAPGSSRGSVRRRVLIAALASIALIAASGCRVVGEVETGRAVSINPCKLVGSKRAQAVMGGPVFAQLSVRTSPEGPAFAQCDYVYAQTYRNIMCCTLSVSVADEIQQDTRSVHLGEFDNRTMSWTSDDSLPIKTIDGLGREARYRYFAAGSLPHGSPATKLAIVVLTTLGAKLEMWMTAKAGSERVLLAKVRSAAVPALGRLEKLPLVDEQPPHDVPPVPICSAVDVPALLQIYESFYSWTQPVGGNVTLTEMSESFGGPSATGAGPVGGGWGCDADLDPHTVGNEPETYHPHAAWWISKSKPSSALPPGGQPVRGVGASAYFTDAAWYFGEKSVTLSVFTGGGRHFDVEVLVDKSGEAVAKRTATAIAQKILVEIE